jgi:hypothetical protein
MGIPQHVRMILFPSFVALVHRIYLNPIQVKVFTGNGILKELKEKDMGLQNAFNEDKERFYLRKFQTTYFSPVLLFRFLESIHSFFSSPIGKENFFPITISSADTVSGLQTRIV